MQADRLADVLRLPFINYTREEMLEVLKSVRDQGEESEHFSHHFYQNFALLIKFCEWDVRRSRLSHTMAPSCPLAAELLPLS